MGTGLYIYSGNKLETLAEIFRTRIYENMSPDDILSPETVVVQTGAMGEFLSMSIALKSHAAMNIKMPFINSFINRVLQSIPDRKFTEHFKRDSALTNPDVMRYRIYSILADNHLRPHELDDYCTPGENRGLKIWQLANELATQFDRYSIYRRDTLIEWATSDTPPKGFQEELYRLLSKEARGREYYLDAFLKLENITLHDSLPKRISLFAASSMPSDQLLFFRKLSTFCEVHLFHLNPCATYWEDIRNEREIAAASRRTGREDEYFTGNPLLASLAVQGRDFYHEIMDIAYTENVFFEDVFSSYADTFGLGNSALDVIKDDILEMRTRTRREDEDMSDDFLSPAEVASTDTSISVHSCHTRRREIEVLHDRILDLVWKKEIAPRDILVLAPDISIYEPFIVSVFGSGPLAGQFAVRDRSLRRVSHLAETFMTLFELPNGRFEYSAIMDFLSSEVVMNKFSLTREDIRMFGNLASRCGARWGFSEKTRLERCGVPFGEYSWSNTIERIFEGISFEALSEIDDLADLDNIPFGSIEGDQAVAFGKIASIIRSLERLSEKITCSLSASEWTELLSTMLDDYIGSDDESGFELEALRRVINSISENASLAHCETSLTHAVIRDILSSTLEMPPDGSLFASGSITFASLIPQRSIPRRVIAILGMNEEDFPRQDIRSSFELFNERRRSDPSRTSDDRFSFLQALLSAGDYLMIFRNGIDPIDAKPRPMSAILGEFENVLKDSIDYVNGETKHRFHEIQHRLQGFHSDYFSSDKSIENNMFTSYSRPDFNAACALLNQFKGNFENIDISPLEINGSDYESYEKKIDIKTLESFFTDHCAWFLSNRIHFMIKEDESDPPDSEPEELNALEKYGVAGEIIKTIRKYGLHDTTKNIDKLYKICMKQNMLVPGAAGRRSFDAMFRDISEIPYERLLSFDADDGISLGVSIGDFTITGKVRFYDKKSNIVKIDSLGSYKHKNYVKILLHTLLAAVACDTEAACNSIFVKSGERIDMENHLPGEKITPSQARNIFESLLKWYHEGQRRPLPIFEYATSKYGTTYSKSGSDAALSAASEAYSSDFAIFNDYNKKWVQLCYGENPFEDSEISEDFEAIGRLLYLHEGYCPEAGAEDVND